MKITRKGQVTIPLPIRRRLGVGPGSEVDFVVEANRVVVRKQAEEAEGRGGRLVRRLRGRATVRMSTDEIMALTRVAEPDGPDWPGGS